MKAEYARRLLDRIGVLRHPCDVDLLVFFVRHPRTLMASEQLAAFLGYELTQISDSMDILLEAGLLTRTEAPKGPAWMYVFAMDTTDGDWLPELLELASSREGRLVVRRELKQRTPDKALRPAARTGSPAPKTERGPRLFRVGGDAGQKPEPIENAERRAWRAGGR